MVYLRNVRSLRDIHRKTSECAYEAWRSQRPSIRRFYLATQRVLFANLMLFRHSGSLVFRRINERYWSFHSNLRRDIHLLQAQRILLGGCILSFAQDKITDEELMSTMKNFTNSPERIPDIPKKSLQNCIENLQVENTQPFETVNIVADPMKSVSPDQHAYNRFANPPLTVFVRQLRRQLLEFKNEFIHSKRVDSNVSAEVPETSSSAVLESVVNAPTVDDAVDAYFSTTLSTVNLHPDGTGFVDDTWDLIVNRDHLRIWRRPVESIDIIRVKTDASEVPASEATSIPKTKYEYRLCGTMTNVTALSFLEVQLNLAYRRHWDDRVVSLDYLNHPTDQNDTPTSANPAGLKGDLIRWVTRFPFPLAQREYVYARRWWMETNLDVSAEKSATSDSDRDACPTSKTPSNYGQYAIVLSRSCVTPDRAVIQDTENTNPEFDPNEPERSQRWSSCFKPCAVLVTAYRSEMLIQAHGRLDELGMNYYLIYYDDPRLPVGNSAFSFVSGKAMNQFISQLHSAALNLHRCGLPPGIDPVVFKPRNPDHSNRQSPSVDSGDRRSNQSPPDSTSQSSPTTPTKPKFFTDYGTETNQNISNVVY